MANENLSIDENGRWVLGAVTNDSDQFIRRARVNPITGALIVEANVVSNNTSIGSTIPGGTAGSVLFLGLGSTLAEDNANFFYDDTNNYLGLGTATPAERLHVVGNAIITGDVGTADQLFGRDSGTGELSGVTIGANLSLVGNVLSSSGGGSSGYVQIQDNGVNRTQRTTLNFVNYFTITDDGIGLKTDVDLNVIELANDATFISTLTSNATFITDIDTIVDNQGYVVGPASSTANAIARYDGTTGQLLQNSAVTVSDVSGGTVTIASTPANELNLQTTTITTLYNSDGGEIAQFFNDGTTAPAFPQFYGELDGSAVRMYALGDDTNIDIHLVPKGSGIVKLFETNTLSANLDTSNIETSSKTFTFPNASGTFAVSASGNIALSASGNITFTGQLPLANGGTGANLSDPGANTLLGWDDTDNAVSFFTIGSGLSYDHATHTLSAPSTTSVTNTTFLEDFMGFGDSGATIFSTETILALQFWSLEPGNGSDDLSQAPSESNHPGIVKLAAATTNAGAIILGSTIGSSEDTTFDFSNPFELEAIVKPENFAGTKANYYVGLFVGNNVGGVSKFIGIKGNVGTTNVWSGLTGNGVASTTSGSTAVFAASTWYRLKITFDGTTVEWFVDGVSLGTTTSTLPSGQGNLGVAAEETGSGPDLGLLIDLIKFNYQTTR